MSRCILRLKWACLDSRRSMAHSALPFVIATLLMASTHADVLAPVDNTPRTTQSSSVACNFDSLDFHESTDVNWFRNYAGALADLLRQQDFDQLDCIADSARSKKARFSSGGWKLHEIYRSLDEPQKGVHATEEDWNDHLTRLERWVSAKPESITARIALAKSYASYAWDARGKGYADTVSDSGWRLFRQRLEKAKSILDDAAKLRTKCPEWYVVMQQVALGQGWDEDSASTLFEQAVALEPRYECYYQMQANFLLPKWTGEPGDSARFAEKTADAVGGTQGDVLYFWIAAQIEREDQEFKRLLWPRIQKGFEQLGKEYGHSITQLNLFARMAITEVDAIAADTAFKQIGENWDQETWRTEKYFNQSKQWATGMAPSEMRQRSLIQEATNNTQTPEGARYQKEIEQRFAPFMRQCAQTAGDDRRKFEFVIEITVDGRLQDALTNHLPAPITNCLMEKIAMSEVNTKQKPFPPPPHAGYWLKVELDASAFVAAN